MKVEDRQSCLSTRVSAQDDRARAPPAVILSREDGEGSRDSNRTPPGAHGSARSFSMISLSVGNRPDSFFEKRVRLSTETMKMPPAPRTRSLSTPSCFLISAARLEARGR